jgi:hypothetical protein
MLHTFPDLGLVQSVPTHCNELIRPQLLEMTDFSGGHHDCTRDSQCIVHQELVLLEAEARKDLTVVFQDTDCVEVWLDLISKSIRSKDDTLA